MTGKRQFGTIRRLQSGRWQARYFDGAGRRHGRSFATKGDAGRWLDRARVEMERGEWRDPRLGRQPFDRWVDQWRATATELRAKTLATYDCALRVHLRPFFGPMPLASISPLDVRRWLGHMSTKGLSPATVNQAFRVLRRVLAVAVESEVIVRNPCRGVRPPAIPRREMRFLTPDEIRLLAEAVEPRYRALVLLGCYGGLRWGELAGLRRGRVDIAGRRVLVVEQVVELSAGQLVWGPPKSAASRRAVEIPTFVVDALVDHMGNEPGAERSAVVFPAPGGGVLRNSLFRERQWVPALRKAGLDRLRIHDMRHTAVALAIATGAHAKALQARFGHASIAVTLNTYGHLLPGQGEAIADGLDQLGRAADQASGTVIPFEPRRPRAQGGHVDSDDEDEADAEPS